MTYRRDLLDIRVVVRPPTRTDARPEFTTRMTPFMTSSRSPLEPEVEPLAAAGPASGATPEIILVKTGFRHIATRVREIVYIESARNYVRVHLESGTALKSRVQIDRLARHLGTELFLRIHRGRLVNMERVRSVRPIAGGRLQLTLSEGSTIIVARDRRRVVLAALAAAAERRRPE
jgi:DNA-binding LytR/AlgR family response regulator